MGTTGSQHLAQAEGFALTHLRRELAIGVGLGLVLSLIVIVLAIMLK